MTGVPPGVIDELRAALPRVAEQTVAALTNEVAEYRRDALGAEAAATITGAVELALGTFLRVATEDDEAARSSTLRPVLEAAYDLGRGEARSGRTMEALLAAYRVGARTAWQEQSGVLVLQQVPAAAVAHFAQLVFAYIDELSSASAAGHRDELATSGRVREQLLERLAVGMVSGETPDALEERAARAGWVPPETVAAVVVRSAHLAAAANLLDPRSLRLVGDLAPGVGSQDLAVLLVADAHRSRAALLVALSGRGAIVGPARPWALASVSYRRVLRAIERLPMPSEDALDTESHLAHLVVTADEEALRDLRERALEPLTRARPAVADRLAETLRAWLLHHGRRDDVAAELNVHPQTVRYRMTQIRELFGDRLDDSDATLELIVALAIPSRPEADR